MDFIENTNKIEEQLGLRKLNLNKRHNSAFVNNF